jgi:hypothetical protein
MAINSSEESPSGIKIYLNSPWNLIKTGFLVLTWIVLASFIYIKSVLRSLKFIVLVFNKSQVFETLADYCTYEVLHNYKV